MPAPKELHPSTWPQLGTEKDELKPPGFEKQELPEKNPAVAFSRFANNLRCKGCGKVNVAPVWPSGGDFVPFYAQTRERTEEDPGAYRVKIHCPCCGQDWFVVWDQNPT